MTEEAGPRQLSLKGTIENLMAAGEGTGIKVIGHEEIRFDLERGGMGCCRNNLEILKFLRIFDNQCCQ